MVNLGGGFLVKKNSGDILCFRIFLLFLKYFLIEEYLEIMRPKPKMVTLRPFKVVQNDL